MVKIEVLGGFRKDLQELGEESPEILKEIEIRVKYFCNNPNDTRLRNHELTGRMEGKWAFNINSDVRIIYKWVGKNTVQFLAIGPHKKSIEDNFIP